MSITSHSGLLRTQTFSCNFLLIVMYDADLLHLVVVCEVLIKLGSTDI